MRLLQQPARLPLAQAVAAGALLLGAGCLSLDRDQARICRIALPALEPPGTAIAVTGARPEPDGVRIAYRATTAGRPPLERFAACRFAKGRRDELVGIRTDRGEIAGASVYLLRRHYIDTPEGVAADPGPG